MTAPKKRANPKKTRRPKILLSAIYAATYQPLDQSNNPQPSAWDKLAAARKPIELSYPLSKYIETHINVESEIIQKFQKELIEKHGEANDEGNFRIDEKETETVKLFSEEFQEYLKGESTIPYVDMTMKQLVAGLSETKCYDILEVEIMLLNPFFKG